MTGSCNFIGEIDGSGYIFESGWISRRDRVLDKEAGILIEYIQDTMAVSMKESYYIYICFSYYNAYIIKYYYNIQSHGSYDEVLARNQAI